MAINTFISRGMVAGFLLLSGTIAFADLLPADRAKGEQLFASKGCVTCHSVNGNGSKIGPDLVKRDLGATPLDLASRLWNHTPAMVVGNEGTKITKPMLTGQDFFDISAYLYFLRFDDKRGNPARGKTVFHDKGCHSCHPLAGKGRHSDLGFVEFPRNITPVFLIRGIWNHSLDMIGNMARVGMKWPRFRETEMADLLEYIKANAKGADDPAFFAPGNPREGKRVFDMNACNTCHTRQGDAAKEGSDLGKTPHPSRVSLTQIASNMWNKGPAILVKMAQVPSGLPKFTSKEMADLLAYLFVLPSTDEPGSVMNGKRLFSEIGCAECHGRNGKRGNLLYIDHFKYPDTSKTYLVASIWNHSLEIKHAAREELVPWPLFGEREIADLVEFIRAPK